MASEAFIKLKELGVVKLSPKAQFQLNLVRFGAKPNDPQLIDFARYVLKKETFHRTSVAVVLPMNKAKQVAEAFASAHAALKDNPAVKSTFDGQAEEHQRGL